MLHDLVDHVAARKFSWDIFLMMLEEHRAPESTRAGLRAVVLAGGAVGCDGVCAHLPVVVDDRTGWYIGIAEAAIAPVNSQGALTG